MNLRSPLSLLLFLAVAVISLGHESSGCGGGSGGDDHNHHHSGGHPTGAQCPPAGGPTAQTFGQAFLESYCLSCHSVAATGAARADAPADVNFDTLDDVRRWAKDIDAHAAAGPSAVNTHMPPDSRDQPTPEEREKLGQWLACGAP